MSKKHGRGRHVFRTKQRARSGRQDAAAPTLASYSPLHRAAAFLNTRLFGGELPACLVTLQRKKRAYGFFAGRRFRSAHGAHVADEIALNPEHFAERGSKKVLSTLGHELVHQWQQHFGSPSRSGYHNAEWARKMREIGLVPSNTGRPGGKPTGQRVTHYIKRGGLFDRAADELIARGFRLAFVERKTKRLDRLALKKRQSKTRYSCPECALNAWAKPNVQLICGNCNVALIGG